MNTLIKEVSCNFNCIFDNVTIYKWEEGIWKLYQEFIIEDN
jgi:hypothetical protein